MVSVTFAVALLSVSVPSDTVLLDFTAPWCGPCQSMESTVAQLSASGFPVRKVNIDNERELAKQFHITSIPCFVLVQNGKEVDRILGPASLKELQLLYDRASTVPIRFVSDVRGQSPEEPLRRIAPNSVGHQRLLNEPSAPARTALLGDSGASARIMPASNPSQDAGNPFRRAAANDSRNEFTSHATTPTAGGPNEFIKFAARLKVEDRDGSSYGTGTIIDTRGDQALILTCGHIFRDSQGQGAISVDLFVPGAQQKLPGTLVNYDLKRDIALVCIKPGIAVTPARVAPAGYRSQVGERVVTVGCDHGQDPTAKESQIIAVDKFIGQSNVQVAGQPDEGRSGGGLFTTDGVVIGVCNYADPTEKAGLFAAASVIHDELDDFRLSNIYRGEAVANATSPATNSPMREQRGITPGPTPPTMTVDNSMPTTVSERTTLADLQNRSDAEVICIVRPRGNTNAKSEVIVLDRASTAFMERLESEREIQQSRRFTSHEVPRSQNNWRQQR